MGYGRRRDQSFGNFAGNFGAPAPMQSDGGRPASPAPPGLPSPPGPPSPGGGGGGPGSGYGYNRWAETLPAGSNNQALAKALDPAATAAVNDVNNTKVAPSGSLRMYLTPEMQTYAPGGEAYGANPFSPSFGDITGTSTYGGDAFTPGALVAGGPGVNMGNSPVPWYVDPSQIQPGQSMPSPGLTMPTTMYNPPPYAGLSGYRQTVGNMQPPMNPIGGQPMTYGQVWDRYQGAPYGVNLPSDLSQLPNRI